MNEFPQDYTYTFNSFRITNVIGAPPRVVPNYTSTYTLQLFELAFLAGQWKGCSSPQPRPRLSRKPQAPGDGLHSTLLIFGIQLWRAGTTPILKKKLREFGLKFWCPNQFRELLQEWGLHMTYVVSAIPRVAPRIPRNSESCSENTSEFRELLPEWPFHSENLFLSKLGWFPGS